MRWQGQSIGAIDDSALPGMETLDGLVRSVTSPEFSGMTFHEVHAKSALNRVPGMSAMPFDWTVNPYRGCSHACVYCVSPDTLVLTANGRQKPIRDITVGEEIIGTERRGTYRHYTRTTVEAKWTTRKRAFRVTLADGTELVASGDHRFLTDRGWKHVRGTSSGEHQRPHLTVANRLLGFGMSGGSAQQCFDADFQRGYLAGMVHGDGMIFHRSYDDGTRVREMHMFRLALADTEALDRSRSFLESAGVTTRTRPFTGGTATRRPMLALHTGRQRDVAAIEALTTLRVDPTESWQAGFLSGLFDAEGSCSRGVLRIANKSLELLALAGAALTTFGIPHVLEAPRPNGVRNVRVTGGLPARQRFFAIAQPAITRKSNIAGEAIKTVADLRVASIVDLGYDIEMIDITTGTGDFIANGVVSHNCFARGTHEYLDLDAGADFDSQIVVKVNVGEVLRRELAKPAWNREHVALGTNTDPYQRAEGRYRLMPGIITALADSGTPFSILTKGTLLRRDLPLLSEAAASVPIHISMSIAVLHEGLRRAIEPGAPSFAARLETVKAVTDAGFSVTVFLMPIVPHLTDSVAVLDDALGRIRAAGARRVIYGAMHLRPGVKGWFFEWLERERPDLVGAYRGLYPGAAVHSPQGYRRWLAARVRPLLRRHRLDGSEEDEQMPRRARSGPVVTTTRGRAASEALF